MPRDLVDQMLEHLERGDGGADRRAAAALEIVHPAIARIMADDCLGVMLCLVEPDGSFELSTDLSSEDVLTITRDLAAHAREAGFDV